MRPDLKRRILAVIDDLDRVVGVLSDEDLSIQDDSLPSEDRGRADRAVVIGDLLTSLGSGRPVDSLEDLAEELRDLRNVVLAESGVE